MNKKRENQNNINIPFVAIQLTSRCNLGCDFCFRRLKIKETSFNEIKKIIKKLAEYNVKTLVLSGGEPLLIKNIKQILILAKKEGLKTVLQTNGILLRRKLKSLASYIDWISTSLDGYNDKTNAIMRSEKQFNTVIRVLPFIKKYKIKVKLGTVVTRKNYKNIKDIGGLIKNYVTVWKLYQFYPRVDTYAYKNKKKFIIGKEKFSEITRRIRKSFPQIFISTHSVNEFNKSPCLLINPDGDVYITERNKDKFIGNLIKDPDGFIENYKKIDISKEIDKNFNKTYNK